jgi:2-polyprenyl-3-methyl-5-hydroxy-6-metoxy-1,4-benzoquinol methylase
MNLDMANTVRKISAQASRVIDGEALVVMIHERKLHRLNSVATRVWELCDGRSIADIAAAIGAEFEVELAVAREDVREFIAELLGLGAVQLEGENV